jgi:toxin CcdB
MKQFDVLENVNRTSRAQYPFLVVLQHDRLADYSAVIVAPLLAESPSLLKTRLHPPISVAGKHYVLITEELAAVSRKSLGPVIGSAIDRRYDIIRALDIVFTGN